MQILVFDWFLTHGSYAVVNHLRYDGMSPSEFVSFKKFSEPLDANISAFSEIVKVYNSLSCIGVQLHT